MKNKSNNLKARLRGKDAIFSKCYEIAAAKGVEIEDHEYQHLKQYHDALVSSDLGGKYVNPDVMQALCYFGIQESFFQTGMELLVNDQAKNAILSLEKAKMLISWPTCLYALGMAFDKSRQTEKAVLMFSSALECFNERLSILNEVIPESLPDRSAFTKHLGSQLDGQVRLLGFENMEELKGAIQMGVSGAKTKKDPLSEMPSINNRAAFKYANKVKALLAFYVVWAVIGYICMSFDLFVDFVPNRMDTSPAASV